MKLLIGLGNPGSNYDTTRHNTGFMAVDSFVETIGAKFSSKTKFQALCAETTVAGDKVLLVKPTTFYNDSGNAVRNLVDFYKLSPESDILVVHDDLALPFGTIRIRQKGSDAGNNGIKSINSAIGPDYARIRVGIYNELRDRQDDADFVLSRFSSDEQAALRETLIPKVIDLMHQFISGALEDTSHAVL